jgi:hypothetical protein
MIAHAPESFRAVNHFGQGRTQLVIILNDGNIQGHSDGMASTMWHILIQVSF